MPLLTRRRYKIGDTFVHIPQSRALERLEQDVATVDKESAGLSDRIEEYEKEMKELKLVLYAKFGTAINLDE